jgi:tRNA (guanine-N7-)-methyltransferase
VRIRQHVNPNQVHFARFRGERPVLDGRPIELEIGCADAQFLFERAAQDPARHYVGLEIREDLVKLVNRRARAQGVPVHAVFCQAQLHMTEIFAPAAVDRVYRRMVDAALAGGIATVARPGAEVFVQSDVWDIALDAMATFERDERFANLAGDWTFWRTGNPYGVRSWREQNAEDTGLPIWRILYRRR